MRPQWCGYYSMENAYAPGDVVVYRSIAYMAKKIILSGHNSMDSWVVQDGDYWVYLGRQENAKIDHFYFPEAIKFPLPDGNMSDPTYICADCWKNHNFAAAFMAEEHRYMIDELP